MTYQTKDFLRSAALGLAASLLAGGMGGCAHEKPANIGPTIDLKPAQIATTQASDRIDAADGHLDRALKYLGQ